MPLLSRKWPFLDYIVSAAPTDRGVYALWRANELVFVGIAGPKDNIRTCLRKHFDGQVGASSPADHFSWELPPDPEARRDEVLEQFKQAHGRLPSGNAA
jgi:hypothetical protein